MRNEKLAWIIVAIIAASYLLAFTDMPEYLPSSTLCSPDQFDYATVPTETGPTPLEYCPNTIICESSEPAENLQCKQIPAISVKTGENTTIQCCN